MHLAHRKALAVIGAGPKGLAVAVKSKVLAEFGFPTDRVTLIEKNDIAANWSGDFGYTNGEMLLGTSPEKDVVFPIESIFDDPVLDAQIRLRLLDFTWMAFLVHLGQYSDWIDRGRPAPCHQRWANYLRWVYKQIETDVTFIRAEVRSIDLNGSLWKIVMRHGPEGVNVSEESFDKLMLTGPGKENSSFVRGQMAIKPPVYSLEAFWDSLKTNAFRRSGSIAIIGAGENAATILLALSKYGPDLDIDVIAPRGFIATRAENFYENQIYSQPDRNGWTALDVSDRREFMERTDLGVFSVHAMTLLNEQRRHTVVPGRVTGLTALSDHILLSLDYKGKGSQRRYTQVVIASGFDQARTLSALLSERSLHEIERAIGGPLSQEKLARHIGSDLAIEGLSAPLHVPMLAGLNQGPGFANLSCLGRLSDRVVLGPLLAEMKRIEMAQSNNVVAVREA